MWKEHISKYFRNTTNAINICFFFVAQNFAILLGEPVPQPRKHLTQMWFHAETTKDQATSALMHMADGSFLVRISEQEPNTHTLTFS